jgi:mannitol-specific phosphotransferase system IIBC component
MADLLNEQAQGKLPYDLLFLWDSIGSIPCRMSVEANNNNPQWNAGAMSQQFGNFINQKITLSRKENQPYTNTMVAINKIWVAPAENKFAQPKMKNKGGDTMFYDSTLILTFGNISNSGVSKMKATKNSKEVEFAKKTKISCDKNHINNVTTKATVVMTSHGFITDDKKYIEKYKKEHSSEWIPILGEGKFDVVEDNSEWEEDKSMIVDIIEKEEE